MAQQDINIGTENAKTGDTLFDAFTKIQANFTELYGLSGGANNVTIINSEDDFPTPSGGVITLENDKVYVLGATVVTANRFECGTNNVITAGNPFAPALVYTGSGTMFTGVGVSFALDRVIIACPSAQAFDFSGVGNTETFGLNISTIGSCLKAGVFNDLRSVNITNSSFLSCTDGISIQGVTYWDTLTIARFRIINQTVPVNGIDLTTSVHKTFEISDYVFEGVSGSVGIAGLANSGNIEPNFVGNVVRCEFPSPITPLDGIASNDVRWSFTGNSGVEDSQNRGDLFLEGGTEQINVVTQGVFYEIGLPTGGANWSSEIQDRFEFNANGYLTYIGEQDIDVYICSTATVEKQGGGSEILEMRIAVNWIAAATGLEKSRSQTQNTQPTSITSIALTRVSNGDTIRPIFANNGSAQDIIVEVTSMVVL